MSGKDFSEDEAKVDRLLRSLSEHERTRTVAEPLPSLPRYEIRGRLGEGATATVYRAFDRELQRDVALKLSNPGLGMSATARERFRREARVAAGIVHPNIVTVHDTGEVDGRLYLVMEIVEGSPLADLLREKTREPRTLVEILEKAARGVAAVHAKGIIHRDLKPANILVTTSGEPKVGDFGLAHLADSAMELTRTGTPLGTPVYMAPEQVEGRHRDITPRTDVYALGAILYEILTGRPPYLGESLAAIYQQILQNDPEPPSTLRPHVPRDLETIALKALEKAPERRYPSAEEFADDLRRFREGESIAARPPGWTYRVVRNLRKRALAWGLAGTVAAAALAIAVLWSRGEKETRREQVRFTQERDEAVRAMREVARTSLSAALTLRRKGATIPELRPFVQTMKDAYARAKERAPRSAEVEYLMGRMRRVVIDHETALGHQNRALEIDPEFAPALYERVILLSRVHSGTYWSTKDAVRAQSGPTLPPDWLERADKLQPKFARTREQILRDLGALERIQSRGRAAEGPLAISEAHVSNGRGILAFWNGDYQKARDHLRDAVQKDPLLDEAWELLSSTLAGFFHEAVEPADRLRTWEEAVECFDQAILHDRGYPRLWNLRSMLHLEGFAMCRLSGRDPLAAFAAAERDAAESCRLMPGQEPAWRGRSMSRYKRALYRLSLGEQPRDDLDEAERFMEEGIKCFAGASESYSLRGAIRLERGRQGEKDGDAAAAAAHYRGTVEDFEKSLSLEAGLSSQVAAPLEEARKRLQALRP